jgi:pectate lyase
MSKLRFEALAWLLPFGSLLACGGEGSPGHTPPVGDQPTSGQTSGGAGSSNLAVAGAGGSGATSPIAGGSGSNAGSATTLGGSTAGGGALASGGNTTTAGGSPGGNAGAGGVAMTGGSPSSSSDGTGAPAAGPSGYGQGTTGGGNATPLNVDSMSAMQAAIDAYESGGLVLKYTGKFDFSSIKDPCVQHTLPATTVEIKNKSDITILGEAGSSANFGIHIAAASSNVIVRNMTIGLPPGGDASDIISIEGMSSGVPKNVWIDHNEMFTSLLTCEGAGDTAFDGMIDVKKGADDITVSYNYLHDHHKVSLNGYSDSDDLVRHITFEHNLFENIGSRTPLQRHGYSHIVNNYFLNVSTSCINVRMGGFALVEANYFEKVVNPVTARDSDEVGFWDLRANNLASPADVAAGNSFGISWTAGNSGTVNATDWTTTAAYPVALGYSYSAQPFQCIHDGLRAAAGAGKGLVTLKCK